MSATVSIPVSAKSHWWQSRTFRRFARHRLAMLGVVMIAVLTFGVNRSEGAGVPTAFADGVQAAYLGSTLISIAVVVGCVMLAVVTRKRAEA